MRSSRLQCSQRIERHSPCPPVIPMARRSGLSGADQAPMRACLLKRFGAPASVLWTGTRSGPRPYFTGHFHHNPARNPSGNPHLRNFHDTGEMGLGRLHVLQTVLCHIRPHEQLKIMKNRKAAGNQPSQPDHNPGHQPDAGDRSEETRERRKRPVSTAHDAGSPIPSSDAEATDGSPEDTPSSDAVAAIITSIVESTCQKLQLTEEQQDVLRQCLTVLLNPESSRLYKGRALLSIIENKLMPSWPDVVENNWPLFQLSQTDVRELVKLARQDRDQNGRNPSFVGGDVRVSAPSTNKELPASPEPSANLKDGGLDAAQRVAPEEKQAPVMAEPKVAAVAVSPVDEQAQGPTPAPEKNRARTKAPKAAQAATQLPVASALSVTPAPAPAPAGTNEQPVPVDTAPPVAKPKQERQLGMSHNPVLAMEPDDQSPATGSAGRLAYLESVIGKGLMFVFKVGDALEEIRDQKLFSPQFKTFAEYFDHKWGWTRARCYQLIGAAQVRRNLLSTSVDTAQLSEPLCRILAKLPTDDQIAAWKEAVSTASNGKLTPEHLKQAVARFSPPAPAPASAESKPTGEDKATNLMVAPDNAQPAASPVAPGTSSQPESAPDSTPARGGRPGFELAIEWPPIEASLEGLLQSCPPDKQQEFWAKLNGFLCRHLGPGPLDEQKGTV